VRETFLKCIIAFQIRELVDYLARGLVDESRLTFIKPFQEALVTDKRQKPFDEDPERRRKVISMVLAEVKGLGQGSERGMRHLPVAPVYQG
jgi:translation initiation factor 3 subunit M